MQEADGPSGGARRGATGVRVLVADDDPSLRALFGTLLRETEGVSLVVEADDGAKAVEAACDAGVDVAVLDLNMPRLDGVQAARLLLALDPSMQVALQSSDPDSLQARAGSLGLPLFDKLESHLLVEWIERQALSHAMHARPVLLLAPRLDLSCELCGYGIVSRKPPPLCPMCHASTTWVAPQSSRQAAARSRAVGGR